MPDVIVNVTPQPTASVEVDVDNVASYYYELAKQWAISPNLVENLDYSSKYYANKSHEYADSILTDAGFIAVSQDLTNIDTVANSIANVNAVANDVTNINLVAADLTNIDSVAGSISNVNSVASDLTNIDSVAGDLTNIDIVASAKTNIDTTATYISNINTVAGSITNVNTVAGDLTNINAVASDLTNIGTVATNITDINTCSTNISDINTCAANISTIADKVSKIGDTMTGDLTLLKSEPAIVLRDTDLDYTSTTAPATQRSMQCQIVDKNNNYSGSFYHVHDTYNNMTSGFASMRNVNTQDVVANFCIGVDVLGNDIAFASDGVKQTITNWAMPAIQADTLIVGATGSTYIAPADGYFQARGTVGAGECYLEFSALNGGVDSLINSGATGLDISVYIPVRKGQQAALYYYLGGNTPQAWFRYAVGG